MDRQELSVAMYALGFKDVSTKGLGQQQQWDRLSSMSSHGSDMITLEDFTSLMKGEINGRDPLENIRTIFNVLQKTDCTPDPHPGLVTLNKLQRACNKFQLKLTEEELLLMIDSAQVDVDRDGGVSEDEFIRVMRWSIWF